MSPRVLRLAVVAVVCFTVALSVRLLLFRTDPTPEVRPISYLEDMEDPHISAAISSAVANADRALIDSDAIIASIDRRSAEDSAPDPAWLQFPRTTFSLPQMIVMRPQELDAVSLFRHDRLNKSDIWIHPKHRDIVSTVVGIQPEHIAALRRTVVEASNRELQLLIDAGLSRRTTLASYYEGLDAEKKREWDMELAKSRARWVSRGLGEAEVMARERNFGIVSQDSMFPGGVFATKWADGEVNGARLVDLPQTRANAEILKVYVLAFCSKLFSCFIACETLTTADEQSLMEEISQLLDAHYPTTL